jgi:chromate transport protein ChrA
LLPGFITSFLFYSLTSFPKKSEFEAVVIALIYTVIINAIIELLGMGLIFIGNHVAIGEWNQLTKTVWSIIIALFIGLLWSGLYNNDIIHKFLRDKKITNQTSYPSEWNGMGHFLKRKHISFWI